MRAFLRKPKTDHFQQLMLRSIYFVCAVMVLFSGVSAYFLTDDNPSAPETTPVLPSEAAMQQLLSQYENMSVQELFDARYEEREYVEELSFDPTKSKYFDLIRDKLKLTDEELDIYRRHGYVSIDHMQRYSFGSAYYQIYAADLPVLITTDSILNALHQSFDALLAELERGVLSRDLAYILKDSHEALATTTVPGQFEQNRRDVDLYLTVARNLLASADRNPQEKLKAELPVPSQFGQDGQVHEILDLIFAGKIQVDGPLTEIYGGARRVDYSQFQPRGHYLLDPALSAYFRCMMWLGRADCGWFVLPTDPDDGIENDPDRELRNAALLALVLEQSGRRGNLESMTRLLTTFVGNSDNLTVTSLHDLLQRHGILSASDLEKSDRFDALVADIERNGSASQRIRSQALEAPELLPYTMPPPALVQMFGQSFIIDSLVLSNVVYDSIFYHGEKVKRMMPKGLDVMAALGNDEALLLLEPELEQYHYSGNLMAASEFVDRCKPEFWESRLYNVWLDALRELDDEIAPGKHVPETLRTRVWQQKQLQTQLASWSELRHDTILVAKQSFTGMPGCEYPAGYVEPYPEFYRKLKLFAENTRSALTSFVRDRRQPGAGNTKDINRYSRHLEFFGGMIEILGKLETIADKELAAKELTPEEEAFLEQTIDRRGSVSFGSGSRPRYDGWFCDLLYKREDALEWSPTIADVHTYPDPFGEPQVLEVGIGDVNFGVIAVNCKDKSTAYVGPVYSYYEFQQPANDRLNDKSWQQKIVSGELPQRPEWMQGFQGSPEKRTVDGLSVALWNDKIHLSFTSKNRIPETREFPDSDAGVAELVNFIQSIEWTGRLSLDLSRATLSEKALDHLDQLSNLAFVALPLDVVRHEATDRFRAAHPDVHVRPEELRMIRTVLCESVSGYGVYLPRKDKPLKPGETFYLYAEFDGVNVQGGMSGYSSRLQMSYQIVDAQGRTVAEQTFPETQVRSRVLPKRFHLAHEVKLPEGLSAGRYQLNIKISDTGRNDSYQRLLARNRVQGKPDPEVPPAMSAESTTDFTVSGP